jgi:hypothetical protein
MDTPIGKIRGGRWAVEITPDDSREQRAALQGIAGAFFEQMMEMLRSEDGEKSRARDGLGKVPRGPTQERKKQRDKPAAISSFS